jgi:hypothetical protein
MKTHNIQSLAVIVDRKSIKDDVRKASARQLETELVVKGGQTDPESVRSVIREWFVPLLVREFMAEQQAIQAKTTVTSRKPSFTALSEESGDHTRDRANG